MAEECDAGKGGHRGWDEPREGEEGVFEDEGADLKVHQSRKVERKEGLTARGLRLARSIETAPPMDWP